MGSEEGIIAIWGIDYRSLRVGDWRNNQASTTVAQQLSEQGIFLNLGNSGYQALLTKDEVLAKVNSFSD